MSRSVRISIFAAFATACLIWVIVERHLGRCDFETPEPPPRAEGPAPPQRLAVHAATLAHETPCIDVTAAAHGACKLEPRALDDYTKPYVTINNVVMTKGRLCPPGPVAILLIQNSDVEELDLRDCDSVRRVVLIGTTVRGDVRFDRSSIVQGVQITETRIGGGIDAREVALGSMSILRSNVAGEVTLHGVIERGLSILGTTAIPPYPDACVGDSGSCVARPQRFASHAAYLGGLDLWGLDVGSVQIHSVYVEGETTAVRIRTRGVIDVRWTWFHGKADFAHVRAEGFGAPEIVADDGIELFGAAIDGNLDLAYATIRGRFYALDVDAGVLQLASASLVDPVGSSTAGTPPWLIGFRDGRALQLPGMFVEGEPLLLGGAFAGSLDLRGFVGDVEVNAASLRSISIDPRVPIGRGSDLRRVDFGEVRTGPLCGSISGTCRQGTVALLDDAIDLRRWLSTEPRGVSHVLRAASAVAGSDRLARDLYLSAKWNDDDDAIFVITGDGRRSIAFYLLVFATLYAGIVLFFWDKPAAWPHDVRAWMVQRWFFAMAVLLPGFLDIGAPTRPEREDGYYWPATDRVRTFCFHTFHVLGWIVVSLLVYVVTRRFV
jgi:hypothetical protein